MISSPRPHEHGPLAGDDEVRRREILADRLSEALDRPSGLTQVDPAVEELLDHLQLEQVPVRVQPLGTAASCLRQGRTAQAGPVPVVELAVRDADDAADLRPTKARLIHLVPLSLATAWPFALNGRQCGSYTLVTKATARTARRQPPLECPDLGLERDVYCSLTLRVPAGRSETPAWALRR